MNINVNLGFGGGDNMGMMQQEPVYQQVAVGRGINNNEYQTIVNCCKQAYLQRQVPYSSTAAKLIKGYLGSEWLVICAPTNDKTYDFSLTSVEGGDYMSFSLDNTLFQVCKIDRF